MVRRLIDFGLSGATPVDKINTKIVFVGKGFWGANDFGGRVRRPIDFGLSGSTPVDKSNVLEDAILIDIKRNTRFLTQFSCLLRSILLWLDPCR